MFCYSCPPPILPTWQDCHELWSKKRRRQMREQQEQQQIQQQQQQQRPQGPQVGNGREKDPAVVQEENIEPVPAGG